MAITTQKKPCSFPLLQRWEQGSFHYRMKNVMQATRMALAIPHRALVSADMDLVRLSTFLTLAGGLVITFAKEILDLITA